MFSRVNNLMTTYIFLFVYFQISRFFYSYLAVFIKGKVGDKYNLKNYKEYDEIEKTEVSGARDLINTFGEEVILIWCALMLKKRIAVYAGDVDRLYAVLRALPQLVPHRRGPWTNTNVWPYISGLKSELANLAEMGVYTAGFIDMEVVTANIGLFDLVVDVSSQSVTVPQHAAETFVLTKFHKDLTAYLVTAAEDAATSEKDIVDGLELRIQSILDKLDTLKVATTEDGKKYVTMDQIHAVGKVNPPFDKFLFAVAQAEGMTSDAAAAAASSSSNDDDAADDKQQQQEQ